MSTGRPESDWSNSRVFRFSPAVQALLIQTISFVLILAVAYAMPVLTNIQLSLGIAAVLQGVVAAVISRWRNMAPWWMPLQLVFPFAAIAVHAIHLPAWIFLAAFLFLAALFWTTFRTQVPYYPSTPVIWQAVADSLPQERALRIIDLGSGFGGLTMRLAALRPDSAVEGVEVAPLPWLVSVLRASLGRSKARFRRTDYERLHLGDYDIVFAYLSPAAMPALWRKARAEMRPGSLLLSCEFDVPGAAPHFVRRASATARPLFGWRF